MLSQIGTRRLELHGRVDMSHIRHLGMYLNFFTEDKIGKKYDRGS